VLTTLLWHDEVRPTDPIPAPTKKDKPAKKEVDAAVELIESFACPWDPSRYEDAFQKRLCDIIKRKGKGQAIELPDEEQDHPSPVPDLMAALERSLEEAKS
jgi:DNA end-binding protein Ku